MRIIGGTAELRGNWRLTQRAGAELASIPSGKGDDPSCRWRGGLRPAITWNRTDCCRKSNHEDWEGETFGIDCWLAITMLQIQLASRGIAGGVVGLLQCARLPSQTERQTDGRNAISFVGLTE